MKQVNNSAQVRRSAPAKRPPVWAGPLLIIVTTLFWMGAYTYPALLTPYLKTLGISLSFSGYIVASYGFTQMVLRFPLALITDRLGRRKPFIVLGLACVLLSGLGLFLTKAPVLILLFRALAGAAAAFWVQITSLYISYYAAEGGSTAAVSRINFCQNVAVILGTFFGARVAAARDIEAGFLFGSLIGLAGLLLALFIFERKKPSPAGPAPSSSAAVAPSAPAPAAPKDAFKLTEPNLFWASMLAILAQMISMGIIQGFAPRYAAELGADTDWIGLMSTLAHVAKAAGTLLCGQILIRWIPARRQLLTVIGASAVLLLVMPWLNLPWLLVQQMLLNAGVGVQMTLLMAQATSQVSAERRTTAMGFFQAVYGLGMVLGPAIVGRVSDLFGFAAAFIVLGMITLGGLLLAIAKLPGSKSKQA